MKYALVTGGSRGIGKAICIELAKDGFYVLINYRSNTTEAQNTLMKLQKMVVRVNYFHLTFPMGKR